jgi:hypothetical protein
MQLALKWSKFSCHLHKLNELLGMFSYVLVVYINEMNY